MPIVSWNKAVKGHADTSNPKRKNAKFFFPGMTTAHARGTGQPEDVDSVNWHLTELAWVLRTAVGNAPPQDYLQGGNANQALYDAGIKRIMIHITEWQNPNGKSCLYVGRGIVKDSAATGLLPTLTTAKLNVRLGGTKKTALMTLEGGWKNQFTVASGTWTFTPWGKTMSLLHELTHVLICTRDVWVRPQYPLGEPNSPPPPDAVYGWNPADVDHPVGNDVQCKALAAIPANHAAISGTNLPHLSWLNAENWTRAIGSHTQAVTDLSMRK